MEKREYIFILIRILLIGGSIFLFISLSVAETSPVRLIFAGLLIVGLISELFLSLTRTRKRILRLLDGFVAGDPARFAESGEDQPLARTLNRISEEIRKSKTDREVQHQYLKSLVDNMDIAIACFDDHWQVKMANESWFEFIGRPYLTKVEENAVPDKKLYETLMGLKPGKKESFRVNSPTGKRTYALQMESFRLDQEEYRLLTAKDIEAEVQLNETEAWHKLLRVLTHEIMNSIAPVSSLSETVFNQMVESPSPSEKQITDWRTAVGAISSRSKSLLNFTQSYRQLSRLPNPVKTPIPIEPIITSIWKLLLEKYEDIALDFSLRSLTIYADPTLLEQLLLNLLKNACEAMPASHDSWIRVESNRQSNHLILSVIDNGRGIPDEILSDIFLPFFTTKQTGSGVGLSLSRQIMQAHGGSMGVGKGPEQIGTRIDLRFPLVETET